MAGVSRTRHDTITDLSGRADMSCRSGAGDTGLVLIFPMKHLAHSSEKSNYSTTICGIVKGSLVFNC